jgi:hypothetical protein
MVIDNDIDTWNAKFYYKIALKTIIIYSVWVLLN